MVRNKKQNVYILLIFNLVLAFIFYSFHDWTLKTPFNVKFRTYFVCFILVFVVPFLAYILKDFNSLIGNAIDQVKEIFYKIKNFDKKATGICIIQYSCGALIAWVIGHIAAFLLQLKLSNWGYNPLVFLCCFTASNILITCWKFRKTAFKNIEKFFFVIAMIVGVFFCFATPREVGISWDDEIHYHRVTNMVNYFNGHGYKADLMVTSEYQKVAGPHFGYSKEDREERKQLINQSFDNNEMADYEENYSISYVAYIPYCIGIILARGVSLSYTSSFVFGRFLNYFFYVCMVVFAMKKIKSGKVLLATIASFPTVLYMAGSYSYDPWIIGLSLYGYATFFGIIQREDKVQNDELVKMLLSFFLAFIVKAVYFPALFPLLFLPRKKFASHKQQHLYVLAVFAVAISLFCSIIMPMFFGGGSVDVTDSRGGEGVNATEQIKYIISNPYKFTKDILDYILGDFICPINAYLYIENYAYMSLVYQLPFAYLSIFLPLIVALYDQDGSIKKTRGITISGCIGLFCSVLLIASALYISYTPVGLNTVNGCQHRYLLPLIFPATYLLGFNCKVEKNDNLFVIVPILIFVATFVGWVGGNLYAGYSNFLF